MQMQKVSEWEEDRLLARFHCADPKYRNVKLVMKTFTQQRIWRKGDKFAWEKSQPFLIAHKQNKQKWTEFTCKEIMSHLLHTIYWKHLQITVVSHWNLKNITFILQKDNQTQSTNNCYVKIHKKAVEHIKCDFNLSLFFLSHGLKTLSVVDFTNSSLSNLPLLANQVSW